MGSEGRMRGNLAKSLGIKRGPKSSML